jgi:outer membrane protein assembly factor BamE
MRTIVLALLLPPLLAACNPLRALSVYRMEIQQGNYLTQEMTSKLQAGMTRDQVRFVLGTPLLVDIFRDNRWDYVYRRQRADSREVEERRLTVFFENDRLVRIEGDVTPGLDTGASPDAAAPSATTSGAEAPAAATPAAATPAATAEQKK